MCSMSLTVVVNSRSNGVVTCHLIRRKTGVLPDDADHRDANVWEDVDRCPQRRQRPDDENEQGEDHKRIGPL